MQRLVLFALPFLLALPVSAAWTVATTGAPSGCTHVISDGNWQIGVYRNSDSDWNLGKWSTATGSYWHWVVEELPSETLILVK